MVIAYSDMILEPIVWVWNVKYGGQSFKLHVAELWGGGLDCCGSTYIYVYFKYSYAYIYIKNIF